VDDVVDAFLRAGAMDAADGEVFNLGGEAPVSLLELAELLHEIAGRGSLRLVPFPPERKRIDIGDFYADASKLKRALGWASRVKLREGLERTLAFYREHKDRYL
jgi:UDP-glucose 4-epimerase